MEISTATSTVADWLMLLKLFRRLNGKKMNLADHPVMVLYDLYGHLLTGERKNNSQAYLNYLEHEVTITDC